jgi:Putative adhesin
MKRIFVLGIGIGLAALFANVLAAQENTQRQRIAMPFSSPTAPRKLVVDGVVGGVTIKGYDGKEAVVEYTPRGGVDLTRRSTTPPPEGMHRIGGVRGLDVTEQDNTIRVNSNSFITGGTDLVIQVPMETSVKVNAFAGGAITVDNIAGEIEATNMAGPVTITNASGSVVAHSMTGKITVALSKVMPDKSMSFSTMNGDIDVTLPSDTKARLNMKTDNGDIFTDFDVTVDPQAPPIVIEDRKVKQKDKNGKDAKTVVRRRARADGRTIGTINGGGPEMQFTTFNGRILIHKK